METSVARDLAVKILFARSCQGDGRARELWAMTADAADKLDRRDEKRAEELASATLEKQAILMELITKELHNWAPERVDKVDLAVLLTSTYELIFSDIAEGIVINDAVELGKCYGIDKSYSFINGVLSTLNKKRDALRAWAAEQAETEQNQNQVEIEENRE